MQQRFLPDIF